MERTGKKSHTVRRGYAIINEVFIDPCFIYGLSLNVVEVYLLSCVRAVTMLDTPQFHFKISHKNFLSIISSRNIGINRNDRPIKCFFAESTKTSESPYNHDQWL
jgi:hypothetical protein